ncbi:MAG: ATP-binding protein [Oscillospiraceae bacterium]|nr:ATP-binding protein [Oscillospiraceae bacterium]
MAKVHLICGRICSGKTTLAKTLAEEHNAVILSCDEVTWALFGNDLGEKHDQMTGRIRTYLLQKAVEIIRAGTGVILDWGFWTAAYRREIREYFAAASVEVCWHYVTVSPVEWERRIGKRNAAVLSGESHDYFVDEGLRAKLERLFEEPEENEFL